MSTALLDWRIRIRLPRDDIYSLDMECEAMHFCKQGAAHGGGLCQRQQLTAALENLGEVTGTSPECDRVSCYMHTTDERPRTRVDLQEIVRELRWMFCPGGVNHSVNEADHECQENREADFNVRNRFQLVLPNPITAIELVLYGPAAGPIGAILSAPITEFDE